MKKLIIIGILFLSSCAHTSNVDFGKLYLQTTMFPVTVLVLGIHAIPPTSNIDK